MQTKTISHKSGESGVVLLTTLLIMLIVSAMMVGFYAAVNSDVRAGAIDRDQTQAYAAAHAGLEKLTSDLAQLFESDVSPTSGEILGLASFPPSVPGFEFTAPGGTTGSGYSVAFSRTDANGNPAPEDTNGSNITAGPYAGMKGIITKYPITITARSTTGRSEVRLRRELQTVAVPVFQFGIFSETDLSIYAGGDFAFGGRVHTNGSLYVGQMTSNGTMTFSDRITAVGEVIRKYLSNGLLNSTTNPSFNNNVLIPTSASTNRALKYSPNEGSVATMPGSAINSSWESLSKTTYKLYVRNGATGATRLDLPIVSDGATPIDLIRRPALNSNENTADPGIFAQRYFSQASLRILLSDRIDDIRNLPTVTGSDPVLLDGNWTATPPTGYGPVDGTHPPIARSPGPISFLSGSSSTTSTIRMPSSTALPDAFVVPCAGSSCNAGTTLTIGTNNNVVCKSKNATQLLQCNLGSNVANGANVSATLANGVVVTTTVNGAVSSGASRTVTLNTPTNGNANFTTAPFSANTFWVNGEMYTCTGYDDTTSPKQFTGCFGDPDSDGDADAPANGSTVTSAALADRNTGTIGGYIKIERQGPINVWTDVTMEILNLGIGDRNQANAGVGTVCNDPTPDAILRIQRLRDHSGSYCAHFRSLNPSDWWPQTLYDAREGTTRTVADTAPIGMGGIMQYISLDVGNLKKWLAGTTGTSGTSALNNNNNGFIVYFSDRRGNHDSTNGNVETGEFGYEDTVNSTTAAGTPDGQPQAGENFNGNASQELYGVVPSTIGGNIPAGAVAPYDSSNNSRPWITMTAANMGQSRVNKVVLFRRALKVMNGGISGGVNNLPSPGLAIATENPAYVQGNYNATAADTLAEPNVAASIAGDAITLLSNAWTDRNSFENPHDSFERDAQETGWRFAAIAGKGLAYSYCAATCGSPGDLYGTDGGAANFLRLLENWSGAGGLNYRGSLVSLHISRQAVGQYKFPAAHTYNGGERTFAFDTEFLTPSLLPPGTPMFRDINTLTFRQILRPAE